MKRKWMLLFLLAFLLPAQAAVAQEDNSNWELFAENINNAFYFIIDKIIELQDFFMRQALGIGKIVLLIAILSAALNYALTGQGLKENVVKIMKATLFFLIVIFLYPRIIGFITSWTFSMAKESIYPSIEERFGEVTELVERSSVGYVYAGMEFSGEYSEVAGNTNRMRYYSFIRNTTHNIVTRQGFSHLFGDLLYTNEDSPVPYSAVAPANAMKIVFFLAGECMAFADKVNVVTIISEYSRVLKGLACAFFLIFTGIFAILEYCICFMEFMLVSSVGIILFPLSIWEGSKFMAEKFIGAIIGFFMKLLFCNLAIFLMLYGFLSLFYILSDTGFQGNTDQIVFIAFVSLMFFYICKSAPGIAQSLLSGQPSLSATGAISAAAGAVGAAVKTAGMAQNAGSLVGAGAGGLAKGGIAAAGTLMQANAAKKAVEKAGGDGRQQAGAWMGSMGNSAAAGAGALTRRLLGGDKFLGGKTFGEHFKEKKETGAANALAKLNRSGGALDHLTKSADKSVSGNALNKLGPKHSPYA
jgi:hypothetical protein